MGARLLRQWLRYPLNDIEHIEARQNAIASLLTSPVALKGVIEALEDVCDIERIVGRLTVGGQARAMCRRWVNACGRCRSCSIDSSNLAIHRPSHRS
jgi:DNA mismatch repair protein MutS